MLPDPTRRPVPAQVRDGRTVSRSGGIGHSRARNRPGHRRTPAV